MVTPPTRVSFNVPASGNFSSATTPKTTGTFDVVTGDLIVVLASGEGATSLPTPTPSASGGSVTWTLQANQPASTGNQSVARVWTGAVGATATGITISLATVVASGLWWGFSATVWRNHGGVGVPFSGNNALAAGLPSVAATCSANSAVQCQINDWNAIDGTSRAWLSINGSAEVEATYFTDSAHHTAYGAYSPDVGTAGSKTQGLSAPTGQRWVLVGIEILGTTGGAAARTPAKVYNRAAINRASTW